MSEPCNTGPFRIACEVTMGLLRRNKDCLMSVLDAFVHDPLVEWEDEKKKMVNCVVVRNVCRHRITALLGKTKEGCSPKKNTGE